MRQFLYINFFYKYLMFLLREREREYHTCSFIICNYLSSYILLMVKTFFSHKYWSKLNDIIIKKVLQIIGCTINLGGLAFENMHEQAYALYVSCWHDHLKGDTKLKLLVVQPKVKIGHVIHAPNFITQKIIYNCICLNIYSLSQCHKTHYIKIFLFSIFGYLFYNSSKDYVKIINHNTS